MYFFQKWPNNNKSYTPFTCLESEVIFINNEQIYEGYYYGGITQPQTIEFTYNNGWYTLNENGMLTHFAGD